MDLEKRFPKKTQEMIDGVRVPLDEAIFIMSYSNSSRAQFLIQMYTSRFIAEGMANVEAGLEAMRFVLVEEVVKGWENLKIGPVLIPYSKEKCDKILKEYEGLDYTLLGLAGDIELFKSKEKKKKLGN